MSENDAVHQMTLVRSWPSGADEWYCRVCGYHFVMTIDPYSKTVLVEAPDVSVTHTGSKGGLKANVTAEQGSNPGNPPGLDREPPKPLGPWDEWMEKHDDLWTKSEPPPT